MTVGRAECPNIEGSAVGVYEGSSVGITEGSSVGKADNSKVGSDDDSPVCPMDGSADGATVGTSETKLIGFRNRVGLWEGAYERSEESGLGSNVGSIDGD